MRFQNKSSLAYMLRNFWKLVYVALPVAILMAFFVNPGKEIDFFRAMFMGELNFDNVLGMFMRAVTVLRFGRFWWAGIITLFVLALTESMLVVKINRHMHVGEMPALPFRRAFKLFPVMLLLIVCYFCIGEIVTLLGVGVMYILRVTGSVEALTACGVAVNFVLRVLCAWLFMMLSVAIPLKYSENYPLNVALAYSVRVMSKRKRWAWCASLLYAVGRYAFMACGYFLKPYKVDIVLYALAYLFIVMILPCFAYGVYHEAVGGERRDISQIMFE